MSQFFAASLGREQNVLDWSKLLAPEAPRPQGWAVPEAFIAVLLSAVTCDGDLAAIEHEELLALAHRSRALMSLTTRQLAEINVKVAERLRQSDDAFADACAAIPEEMRLSLFAHALDLVLADGDLNQDEADFLNALILNLKLDREGVERVADVIMLKNRY
jgi:uncharacterized tellurite resistance protein B-like protein